MQGAWDQFLVREPDPTCLAAKKKKKKPKDKLEEGGLPGSSVVKHPPANASNMGSIPDLGRSHIPQNN